MAAAPAAADNPSVMGARRTFRATVSVPANGRSSVTLAGALDLNAAAAFREALVRAIDEGSRRVVVDLSRVTFIDSTALGVIVGGLTRLRAVDGTLEVICPDGELRRIFEVSGLDRVLDIAASREEAAAGA